MLCGPTMYSFLRAHPAMKFKADVVDLPGGFKMAYNGQGVTEPVTSELHGQTAAMGQTAFVLQEDRPAPDGLKQYCSHVPAHSGGFAMELCLIAEVAWTQECYYNLQEFYRPSGSQAGRFFEWPGIEGIAVCPGTGEAVQPDGMHHRDTRGKKLHLLCAHSIHGFHQPGSELNILDRVIPRILTVEGFERLMGGVAGSPNRCVKGKPVYPDALRRSTTGKAKAPKRPPSAGSGMSIPGTKFVLQLRFRLRHRRWR